MEQKLVKRAVSKILRGFDPQYMPIMPSVVLLELTRICNCNCRTCYRPYVDSKSVCMSDELIQRVIEQLFPHIYQLNLIGLGESLCSRHFWPVIDKCDGYGIRVCTSTNGKLINEKSALKLGQNGAMITLSLDGRNNETLEYIRPGINAETMQKAMSCFQMASQQYQQSTNFQWSTHTVITRANLNELVDIVHWAGSYGCRKFTFGEFDIFDRSDPFTSESLVFDPGLYNDLMETLAETARQYNAELVLPVSCGSNDSSTLSTERFGAKPGYYFQKCYSPWRECNILVNGDVHACCILDREPLGNLASEDFRKIWNNENYRRFRRTIHSGNPPAPCQHCAKDFGITGGNTQYFTEYKKQSRSH